MSTAFSRNKHPKNVKLLITIGCCLIFFLNGMSGAIISTSMIDLAHLDESDSITIAKTNSIASLTYSITILIS